MAENTHRGDSGYTDLLGARRVPKYDAMIEALGALDEGTSALGVARQAAQRPETRATIRQAQHHLYEAMAEVAMPLDHAQRSRITSAHVAWVEAQLAEVQLQVTIPRKFVLPGTSPGSASVDLARAIIRRAERRVAQLAHAGTAPNPHLLTYINRLSLLLYMAARAEDVHAGVDFDLAGADSR